MCTCAIQADDPDSPVVVKTNRMSCSFKWRDMPQNQVLSIQLDCDLKPRKQRDSQLVLFQKVKILQCIMICRFKRQMNINSFSTQLYTLRTIYCVKM